MYSLFKIYWTCLIFILNLCLTLGQVQTTSGSVRGVTEKVPEWGDVIRYYGIPYAKVPRRFDNSIPLLNEDEMDVDGKQEIYNKNPLPACPQTEHMTEFSHDSIPQGGLNVTEDCLKLNIFSPVTSTSSTPEKLPILMWIPGEGFSYGDSKQYDGSALAVKGKILVVTINYRVGVFGFMSTGNGTLPGNAGLHDILNAIKWIKTNAHAFNGDSENITLSGRFSGAMAISALVVSPLFLEKRTNKDDSEMVVVPLAKRVMLHDGIATGRYVLDFDPLAAVLHLANLTHCADAKLDNILDCFRNLPTKTLLETSMNVPQLWKPVIDHVLIKDDPLQQMVEHRFPTGVDLMIGDNNGAGSICFLTHHYLKTSSLSKIKSDNLSETDLLNLIKHSLQEYYKLTDNDEDGLAPIVAHEYIYSPPFETLSPKYYGEGHTTLQSYRTPYLRFCGVMYIRHSVEVAARAVAHSPSNKVYRYEWAYRPASSKTSKWLHASIGEEVIFAFPGNSSATKFSKDDHIMRDKLMTSWIQFVKTGSPGTDEDPWHRFEEKSKKMIRFSSAKGMVASSSEFLDRDVHFWRESMRPLVKSWLELRKLAQRKKVLCPLLGSTSPSTLSQALLGIVILMGVTLGTAFIYFFLKNWRKPRSLWRF